jgi:hypothetical protein
MAILSVFEGFSEGDGQLIEWLAGTLRGAISWGVNGSYPARLGVRSRGVSVISGQAQAAVIRGE